MSILWYRGQVINYMISYMHRTFMLYHYSQALVRKIQFIEIGQNGIIS